MHYSKGLVTDEGSKNKNKQYMYTGFYFTIRVCGLYVYSNMILFQKEKIYQTLLSIK